MPILKLGNSTVSGPLFDMRASDVTFDWNNYNQIEQEPGKAISSGLNARLPSHRYGGHASPGITFNAWIDNSLSDPTYNSLGDPLINTQWLGSLALVASGWFAYPNIINFLGQGGVGSISVSIDSIKLTKNVQYFKDGSEYLIAYNVRLSAVSGPI